MHSLLELALVVVTLTFAAAVTFAVDRARGRAPSFWGERLGSGPTPGYRGRHRADSDSDRVTSAALLPQSDAARDSR